MEFASAYLLTVLIETTALYAILRRGYPAPLIVSNSLIANTLTHPIVWFAFPLLWPGLGWTAATIAAEMFAFLAETAAYKSLFGGIRWRDAGAASLLCNALSFTAGLALAILFNL